MSKRYQCKACGHCCILVVPNYVKDKPYECPYHSSYYTAWQLLEGCDECDEKCTEQDIPVVTGYSQRWIYKASLTCQGVDINP